MTDVVDITISTRDALGGRGAIIDWDGKWRSRAIAVRLNGPADLYVQPDGTVFIYTQGLVDVLHEAGVHPAQS